MGHLVTCIDVDGNKIKALQHGQSPINEDEMVEIV
ncbi:hypothetical protein R4Z10_12155 [Niallia sp. XMNu-256]